MSTDPALLALLQFGDGLFPAGGFAHSFGLETYAQQGRLRGAADLDALIAAHLDGAAGPADAVAVALAARAASSTDVAALVALDDRLDAMKCVPEFRSASLQMGRQTLRVAAILAEGRRHPQRLAAHLQAGGAKFRDAFHGVEPVIEGDERGDIR